MMKSSTRVTWSSPIRKVVMGFPLPNHAVVFAEASNRQLGNGALLSQSHPFSAFAAQGYQFMCLPVRAPRGAASLRIKMTGLT
jgi:hypothetical protein